MIGRMEPADFDKWLAFYTLEPDPEERLREIVKRGLALIACAWGGEVKPDDLDEWAEREPQEVTGQQAVSIMRNAFGA